jgi:hypothetical protein
MYDRRWRRSRLMHYRRRRWRWLLMHRCWLRRRRVHIVFRLPLRSRRESLRRRIVVLPFPPCWRRAFIIRAPYRFRRRLMVIAWPIKIASAITRTTSRLLINYFRIMVAIDSSMIIVDIWLWLRWRVISPRHSRYVIVGIGALVASVSTGTAEGVLVTISNSASNWATASSHGSTGCRRWFMMISVRIAIDNSLVCGRKRRTESWRRIHQPGSAIPSVPAARRPAPAASVHKYPPPVAIRHPAPRIRRNPGIAKSRRVAPISIAEWVPVVANVVRLPDFAVSRNVIILSVIIQVACPVLIRRLRVAWTGRSVSA